MKKILNYSLLVLLSCNTISDEGKKKQEAQFFYDQLSSIINEVAKSNNQFTLYFRKIAPLAKQNFDYKIEKPKIDTLNKLYFDYVDVLNKAIDKLNLLEESDTSFKIKNSFTKVFIANRRVYAATIPTYLYVYLVGWRRASEYEKNIIMNADNIFENAAKEIRAEENIATKQLINFMEKYKIKSKNERVD